MVNKNIQMKKKNGQSWDNLFPLTLTENVFTNEGLTIDDHLENVDDRINDNQLENEKNSTQLEQISIQLENFDGVNDDEKFEKALAYCKEFNKKRLLISEDVVIKKPIVNNVPYLSFYSDTRNDIMPTIRTSDDFIGESLIDVKAPGTSYHDLRLLGHGDYSSNNLTAINYDFEHPDCDSFVQNCVFSNFQRIFNMYGRNVRVQGCTIASAYTVFDINKHENVNSTWGNDIRGILITDNIFHSIASETETPTACIFKVNDITPHQNIVVSDNLFERGIGQIFKGYYHGFKFTNNVIATNPLYTSFEFYTTPDDITTPKTCVIADNDILGGAPTTVAETEHFIVGGELHHCFITDNIMYNTTKETIKVEGLYSSRISNNVFKHPSYKYPQQHNAVHILGQVSDSDISNNMFIGTSYKHAIYIDGLEVENTTIDDNKFDSRIVLPPITLHPWIVGGRGFTTNYVDREQHESVDMRSIVEAPRLIHKERHVKFNPDTNKRETVVEEVAWSETPLNDDPTKINGKKEFFISTNGVLDNKMTIDRQGVQLNDYLRLGNYYFWVDGNGDLRINNGEPDSDLSGKIIGG